jgi:hypothetical protein
MWLWSRWIVWRYSGRCASCVCCRVYQLHGYMVAGSSPLFSKSLTIPCCDFFRPDCMGSNEISCCNSVVFFFVCVCSKSVAIFIKGKNRSSRHQTRQHTEMYRRWLEVSWSYSESEISDNILPTIVKFICFCFVFQSANSADGTDRVVYDIRHLIDYLMSSYF